MAASAGDQFELWCEEQHELIIRERLLSAEAKPRVVWLPRAPEEITYLKVFELQAEFVWTESLVEALVRYGVEIPPDRVGELRELLPAHAKEWIDRPREAWRELTVGTAKSTLVDDDRILEALAHPGTAIADWVGRERLGVFRRRVTEDFGLPAFTEGKDLPAAAAVQAGDEWRIAATASLLVTEAAIRVPASPPSATDQTIPPGPARERALKLLDRWQKHIEFMPSFETLARQADGTTGLVYWARNLTGTIPALASPVAEDTLFQREVEALACLDEFEPLARRLEEREAFYSAHAAGFWGARAERRVPWQSLVTLARAAVLLERESSAENSWKTPSDAVEWFTRAGWEIDRQGELLFKDDPNLPGALHAVRARLRRAYLRHVDRTNGAFSELIHHHGFESLELPFAGELIPTCRPPKEPAAVLVLDACRYDLGARLAERLNQGEPVRRAEVRAARAPIPSITALGMPFALAEDPNALRVELTNEALPRWRVTAPGTGGDLTAAGARREWLQRRFKLKSDALTDVKSILDAPVPSPKDAGRLLFVFGDEFDTQGHEGELRFSGAEGQIERYTRAIGRLREAGFTTILVVTDHGFIHWEPERDEVVDPPAGEILWRSRRAIVGRGLKHPTALCTSVPQSDLECCVPRSVNAFRTYGGVGFFHGGATLQELVIPVVVVRWPKKAEKVAVVLTPLAEIVSLRPRLELKPGAGDRLPGLDADERTLGRHVTVKVVHPTTGRRLFRSPETVKIEPDGAPVTVTLVREQAEACARGTRLQVEVRDADNDEILDRCEVELKIDLEEWD
ncbi:PglZ domain-containing protein [Nitrospira sp. Kam-Ns4a]